MLERTEEYFKQGLACFKKQHYHEALEWITRCTNGDMQNTAAWKLKIKILIALNQPNEAEDCRAIVWDIQKRSQLIKTPELKPAGVLSREVTINLDSVDALQQLAAFSGRKKRG